MKHQDIQNRLSEYIDGELAGPVLSAVEAHLSTCSECVGIVSQFRNIRAGIKERADVELSGSFSANALRSIRLQIDESGNWTPAEFIARRTVLALSIVVLLLVGLTSFNFQEEEISVERYLRGEASDSAESQILFNGDEISKDDVLMAAVSKQ
ncbi:MAG: zf-HC2 domain-containing protein [Ignavibacteriales bacterium]|nr:zf-HC2 domain-containing protein [Ignavibacteriales bacterium]